MKHLFYVHSHMTFLVANQFICDNHIESNDCMFILCSRYSTIPIGYSYNNLMVYPNELLPHEHTRVLYKHNLFIGHKNIRHIENIIKSKFSNDTFIFYVPNPSLDLHSVIVTMKQCCGYYLLEEGTASYCPLKSIQKLWRPFDELIVKYILRPSFERYYYLKTTNFAVDNSLYLGTIATSKRAFIDYPGQHILVSCPFSKVILNNVPDLILSIDYSLYISLDKVFPHEFYYFLADYLINKCGYKHIAYKFHPNYYADTIVLEQFRKGLKSVFGDFAFEFSENYTLENILNSYTIDFCSDVSSVGIYASDMGRKCISYLYLIPEFYPDSKYKTLFIDTLPQITKDSYIFINEKGTYNWTQIF